MPSQPHPQPVASSNLALKKETVRQLTAREPRLVAGGACGYSVPIR